MEGIVALAVVASFSAMNVGLFMFLPFKNLKPKRKIARNLSLGGFLALIFLFVIDPGRKAPDQVSVGPTASQQANADEVSSGFPPIERSDPRSDLKMASKGFYQSVLDRFNPCAESSAGAYLSGESLQEGGTNLSKYRTDTLDAVEICKNSVTLLGTIPIPNLFSEAAHRVASQLVTNCQRIAYQNQDASRVVASALDSGLPIMDMNAYLQLQKKAQSTLASCGKESDDLALKTGVDLAEMVQVK